MQQLQAEVRQLNGTLTGKLTELTQLHRDAAALTAETAALRQQLGQVRAEKERAERNSGKAHEQVARLEAESAALVQRLDAAVLDLVKLREILVARDGTVRELELASTRLQAQLDGAQQTNAELRKRFDELQLSSSLPAGEGRLHTTTGN